MKGYTPEPFVFTTFYDTCYFVLQHHTISYLIASVTHLKRPFRSCLFCHFSCLKMLEMYVENQCHNIANYCEHYADSSSKYLKKKPEHKKQFVRHLRSIASPKIETLCALKHNVEGLPLIQNTLGSSHTIPGSPMCSC